MVAFKAWTFQEARTGERQLPLSWQSYMRWQSYLSPTSTAVAVELAVLPDKQAGRHAVLGFKTRAGRHACWQARCVRFRKTMN